MMSAENAVPASQTDTDASQASPGPRSPRVAPAAVADAGKIRLGGAFRLPAAVADGGKIRLGGAFRLPARRVAMA